ncbi:MAG: NAD(P)/FAD-dependent oxidoreductase [Paracoccaceae bacterium]
MSTASAKRVVILGAGFAGLSAARRLKGAPVDVTVIDKRNYHLFQPFLYQVATAALNPSEVAWPIRSILRGQSNAKTLLADVEDIDAERKVVRTNRGETPYDVLVVATGAKHSYFGNPEWEAHAPGLKRIMDATEIRKRLLLAFERAETTDDEAERRQLMTFVVVGGGPTGVEMAGAIAELAHHCLENDFRHIDPKDARIMLVEGGERILSTYPPDLSDYAKRALERLGVEVVLNQLVSVRPGEGAEIAGEVVPASAIVWGAGVTVPRVAKWFGLETDKTGRVEVGADLRLAGHDDVFVIGDAAKMHNPDGSPVPGLAPAAKQAGRYVAKAIAAAARGEAAPGPFEYTHLGSMATIGRNEAVADFGRVKLRGRLAWWLWGLSHIYFLIGSRSKAVVAMQWLWYYLTYDKGARLITGLEPLSRTQPVDQRAPHPAE